ncbi:hypothetical protein [Cystobacter fuscus]|uniref:hypothetical protein n=1 Tax=Cystobacter fuscus TaxID=43 RepID=UPI0018DFC9FA|nr:hypothetical protein [Cystobacter fuscus]
MFLLLGDAVVTPPLEAPCLPGIITNSVSRSLAVPRLLGRELPGSHALAERARAVVWEYARREE